MAEPPETPPDTPTTLKAVSVADTGQSSPTAQAAMVNVSVELRWVGLPTGPGPSSDYAGETSPLEQALHEHLKRQEDAISGSGNRIDD